MAIPTPRIEGDRYDVEVADTFDLAERARLAINVLSRAVVPSRAYAIWHEMNVGANPPYFRWANWISYKVLEALPRMRAMCGDQANLDVEQAMMQAHVDRIGPYGLLYYPSISPDQPPDTAYAVGCARMILAMSAWYERDGDPGWVDLIRPMAAGLGRMAISRHHYAYFPLESGFGKDGQWAYTRRGGGRAEYFPYTPPDEPAREQQGHEGTVKFEAGTAIRALVKSYRLFGDEGALELAKRLGSFLLLPSLWENSWPAGAPDHEHGVWAGHFHGNTMPLRGLLDLAIATEDTRLKNLVREAYEHGCAAGIRQIGWFPGWIHPMRFGRVAQSNRICETCAIANMVALAVALSDAGIGDYWDDVDAFVRNQLAEQQLVDRGRMEAFVERLCATQPRRSLVADLQDPWALDLDNVLDRTIGGFGMATPAALEPLASYACCAANGALGLYAAWEGILRHHEGTTTVNLLLNRASPWADVESLLPFEGRVRIVNKASHTVAVRIPSWVALERVEVSLDGARVAPKRIGRMLVVEDLRPSAHAGAGEILEFTFPVASEECRHSAQGEDYRFRVRASTVLDVIPRRDDPLAFPIYQRGMLERGPAPRRVLTRFVPRPGQA